MHECLSECLSFQRQIAADVADLANPVAMADKEIEAALAWERHRQRFAAIDKEIAALAQERVQQRFAALSPEAKRRVLSQVAAAQQDESQVTALGEAAAVQQDDNR
jgi:hypothetical protein